MSTTQQQHAIAEMTTFELKAYRRNLETGLAVVTEDTATRAVLQNRLAEVQAEETERAQIRADG